MSVYLHNPSAIGRMQHKVIFKVEYSRVFFVEDGLQ